MLTQELRAEIEAGQGEGLTQAARRFPPAYLGRPVTLGRFVEAQTPRPDDAPPAPRTSGVRRRAADRAIKELERLGM